MKPYHRPSVLHDVCELAPNMRFEDKREVATMSGHTPEQSLCLAYLSSGIDCRSIIDSYGRVVGMYGASQVDTNVGQVWMLGSKGLLKISREFLRQSKIEVNKMNTKYNLLCNFIDSRNEIHIRWIRWCGFKIIGEKMFNSVKFFEFSRVMK